MISQAQIISKPSKKGKRKKKKEKTPHIAIMFNKKKSKIIFNKEITKSLEEKAVWRVGKAKETQEVVLRVFCCSRKSLCETGCLRDNAYRIIYVTSISRPPFYDGDDDNHKWVSEWVSKWVVCWCARRSAGTSLCFGTPCILHRRTSSPDHCPTLMIF